MTSQVTGNFQAKWPENLDELKLTPQEAQVITDFAMIAKQNMPEDTVNKIESSSYNTRFYSRKKFYMRDGQNKQPLPRSLYVTNTCVMVILNKHGGMPTIPGGAQQSDLKFCWDLVKGKMHVKKTVLTRFEEVFYNWLVYSPGVKKPESFPQIAGYYKRNHKTKILESYYPQTLSKLLQGKNWKIDLSAIVQLQEAIAALHSFTYVSPKMIYTSNGKQLATSPEDDGKVFHGDISPNNIMCVPENEQSKLVLLRVIDFGASAQFDLCMTTPGYTSPETARFIQGKMEMDTAEFNTKYGQKRDAWNLGLVIGSFLQAGFHPDFPGRSIPPFSFIATKIRVIDNKIDDSLLADLTQNEVDEEIDAIIAKLETVKDSPVKTFYKQQWAVLKQWLVVNPETRKSVEECHLGISE